MRRISGPIVTVAAVVVFALLATTGTTAAERDDTWERVAVAAPEREQRARNDEPRRVRPHIARAVVPSATTARSARTSRADDAVARWRARLLHAPPLRV